MKRGIFFVLVLGFFLVPVICRGAFDFSDWRYFKEINFQKSGLNKIEIDDEILGVVAEDLRDLRIVNLEGEEAAYKKMETQTSISGAEKELKMFNSSFVAGYFSSAVFDLGNSGILVNNLKLRVEGDNFQRNVKVYGSDDAQNWNVLKEAAYVYDYNDARGNFRARKTEVDFSESVFRYLKVEISDQEGKPLKIGGASAFYSSPLLTERKKYEPKFSLEENSQRKSTEMIFDFQQDGIPKNEISLQAGKVNFHRKAAVYAKKGSADWQLVGEGDIFRYDTEKFRGENLTFSFPETSARWIKLEIFNGDNQSLKIERAVFSSLARQIIFSAEYGKKYRLYYSNSKASRPEYDMEAYFKYLDVDSVQSAQLGKQRENGDFAPGEKSLAPFSERVPYLLTVALVTAGMILLILVFRFLKK